MVRFVTETMEENSGRSILAMTEAAVDLCCEYPFLDEVNAAHARLREDPEAWADELAERKLSAGTMLDGLEDD